MISIYVWTTKFSLYCKFVIFCCIIYNSIFNIRNPPIKSILSNYLNDPSFSNFYLFFVVSNNFKKDEKLGNIDTCDKQLQLLYDTRVFMDIIANDNANGITCNN